MANKKSFIHNMEMLEDFFSVDEELPDPETYPENTFIKPKLYGQPLDSLDLYPEQKEQRLYQDVYTKQKVFIPGKGYLYYWYRSTESRG